MWDSGPRSAFTVPRHRDEPVRPIDTQAWIQHTNAMRGMPSILEGSVTFTFYFTFFLVASSVLYFIHSFINFCENVYNSLYLMSSQECTKVYVC